MLLHQFYAGNPVPGPAPAAALVVESAVHDVPGSLAHVASQSRITEPEREKLI